MDTIKKMLGIVWIALAFLTAYFCVDIFGKKLVSGHQEDLVFGIIVFFILLPLVVVGLLIFGYYSLTGEYDKNR
jgi:nitric oxide reductase large subunit